MPKSIIAKRGGAWTNLVTQLVANVAIAVGIPYAIRASTLTAAADIRLLNITAISIIFAITVSIWMIRNIFTYPGAELGSNIVPSIFVSFTVLLAIFILTRLQYSRALLISSFVLTTIWMIFVSVRAQGAQHLSIGIIPFGNASEICELPDITWKEVDEHERNAGRYDVVVTDLRVDLPDKWDRRLADYALSGVQVIHYKHLIESLTGRVKLEHLYENSSGSLSPQRAYMVVKNVIDWILALVIGIILIPFYLIVAVAIKLDSAGPVLFRQERIGYRGKPFRVIKFRTMRQGSELSDARQSAMTQSDDARITRLGRILRKTRIDELPQVMNILKGEMSWIGPRPEAVALSRWYEQDIAFYRYRHIVRPGISGWAQVNQGHVTDVEDVRNKLHYDFYYIKNYSPWIDLLIVTKTIITMISGSGAK